MWWPMFDVNSKNAIYHKFPCFFVVVVIFKLFLFNYNCILLGQLLNNFSYVIENCEHLNICLQFFCLILFFFKSNTKCQPDAKPIGLHGINTGINGPKTWSFYSCCTSRKHLYALCSKCIQKINCGLAFCNNTNIVLHCWNIFFLEQKFIEIAPTIS